MNAKFSRLILFVCLTIVFTAFSHVKANGYNVMALELTDPENTPKNTLIKAVKNSKMSEKEKEAAKAEYDSILRFVLRDGADTYLSEIRN